MLPWHSILTRTGVAVPPLPRHRSPLPPHHRPISGPAPPPTHPPKMSSAPPWRSLRAHPRAPEVVLMRRVPLIHPLNASVLVLSGAAMRTNGEITLSQPCSVPVTAPPSRRSLAARSAQVKQQHCSSSFGSFFEPAGPPYWER